MSLTPLPTHLASLEPLENRTLLAWGDTAQLVGLDYVAENWPNLTGEGVSVAIIDTGVNYNDSALGGGFGAGHRVVAGYDFVDNDSNPMDEDGHGTAVASIIAAEAYSYGGKTYRGVAPGVNIIALRTEDGSDVYNESRVEDALQWIISHRDQYNIVAVNMSIGDGHYSTEAVRGTIGDELTTLANAGVFLAASSGNSGVIAPYGIEYPAAHPSVYSVGSVDSSDIISDFTERGSILNILAPGEQTPAIAYDPHAEQRLIVVVDGTSFAVPFVVGTAALMRQIDPSLSPAQIMGYMTAAGESNYDGDEESSPYTGLTFPSLRIADALGALYADLDDVREENDWTDTATTLTFNNSTATMSNLKLIAGDDDFYKFTLTGTSQVTFHYTAADSIDWSLVRADGGAIATLGQGTSRTMSAGTYYIYVAGPSETLSGTYALSIGYGGIPASALPGGSGASNDIAFSSGGRLHMAWYDAASESLKYAYRSTTGNWSAIQTIDARADVGKYVSLALDPNQKPGVAYYDATNKNLKYASYDGSNWTARTISSTGDVGYRPSLAYDPSGRVGISYQDSTKADLKFAYYNGSAWSTRTLYSSGTVGAYSSIAYNPSKKAFAVAYLRSTSGLFRYAQQASAGASSWSHVTVDDTVSGGRNISLAFDNSNRPAFSYYDSASADLKYARYNGSSWQKTTVASSGSVGTYSNLTFTQSGQADIIYYNASQKAVYGARGQIGSWSIRKLSSGGGTEVAAARDIDDTITFTYRNASRNLLEVIDE